VYGIVDIYLRPLRRDLRDLRDLRDDLLLRRLPPIWSAPDDPLIVVVVGGSGGGIVDSPAPSLGKSSVLSPIANEIYTTRRKRYKDCLKIIWNEENAK
jgi:hypothetical protein